MDNNTFESQLNDKLKDHESEYSTDAWKDMQAKLDNAKKPFGSGIKRSGTVLALLILLLSVSCLTAYEFSHKSSKNDAGSIQPNKSQLVYKPNKGASNSIVKTQQIGLASIDQKPGVEPYKAHIFKSTQRRIILSDNEFPSTVSNAAGSNNLVRNQSLEIAENQAQPANKEISEQKGATVLTHEKEPLSTIISSDSAYINSKPIIANNIPKKEPVLKSDPLIDSFQRGFGKKRAVSFGLYVGFDMDMTSNSQGSLSTGDYNCGLFINYPLTDKLSIQTGLGYKGVTDKVLVKSDTLLIKNDIQGYVYQVTQYSSYYIGYLHLPIILKYSISPKFKICFGPDISYGLTAPLWSLVNNFKKNSSGHYQYANPADSLVIGSPFGGNYVTNYNPDINRFSLGVQLGIQWNMSKSFDLSLLYSRELTNVLKTENQYIETEGNINNNALELRLSYKLFHKRFPEN